MSRTFTPTETELGRYFQLLTDEFIALQLEFSKAPLKRRKRIILESNELTAIAATLCRVQQAKLRLSQTSPKPLLN